MVDVTSALFCRNSFIHNVTTCASRRIHLLHVNFKTDYWLSLQWRISPSYYACGMWKKNL